MRVPVLLCQMSVIREQHQTKSSGSIHVNTVYRETLCNRLLARCLTEVSLLRRGKCLVGLMEEKKDVQGLLVS